MFLHSRPNRAVLNGSVLNYSERFYTHQFLTRKKTNHQVLDRLEDLVSKYFDDDAFVKKGLPTVGYPGEMLNVSPKYLSSLLRTLTGQNALQHVHVP